MDYTHVQRMNDSTDTRGIASYLKGGFIGKMPGELVSALVDGMQGDPRRMTVLFFQHCGGASSRVAEGATAFAHRYALANMMTVAAWPINASADDTKAHIEATRRYWKTLEPYTRGFYVNDLAREVTAKELNDNYRSNYQRLVALKMKYDPTNLFRLNANVTPMKGAKNGLSSRSTSCGGRPMAAASPRTTIGRWIRIGSAIIALIHSLSPSVLPAYLSLNTCSFLRMSSSGLMPSLRTIALSSASLGGVFRYSTMRGSWPRSRINASVSRLLLHAGL